MKVLIGTPIHEVKDYCMERWLENVSELQQQYPTDLFLVDNSPGLDYMEKVKAYCRKYGIKNYKLMHIELPPEQEVHERVARSREIIRQKIISGNYDAWFSWECDQLIPINALGKLIDIMKSGDISIVEHNSWGRGVPDSPNVDWGVALVRREALKKYSFILKFGTEPEMPKTWETGEDWFRQRVVKGGGSFVDVYGIISPIYHLDG